MKRIVLLLVACLTILSGATKKTRHDNDNHENMSIQQMISKLNWKKPALTGYASIDSMYERSDMLYKAIKTMGDSVPIYSLRAIVENGDTTAILVVDQNNRPYSSFSAVDQIVLGSTHIASVTMQAAGLASKYATLIPDLPNIIKADPLKSVSLISGVTKHSKQIGKLAGNFLPNIKNMYEKRGNPIKKYNEVQKSLSKEDGFVTTGFDHIPEFTPEDMPSDEELDMILDQERSGRGAY